MVHCDICNKTIKLDKNWTRHLNSKKHIKLSIQKAVPHKNGDKTLTNPHKPSQTLTNASLETSECEYCSKQFTRKDNLKRHMDKYCKKKKEHDAMQQKIADLEAQLKNQTGGNTTNNNTTNNNNNNTTNNYITNNNIIVMQNFGNELVNFSDEFLHQLTHPDLSHQERRIMLENYISSEQASKTLAKTNMRDRLMYAHEGEWKVIPQRLALTARVDDIPSTYQRSAVHTITNWPEEEASKASKQAAIQQHSGLAMEMKYHKYTDEEDRELKTIIKCNAYNNKAILSTDSQND